MNYLLDTHTILWYFAGENRLPKEIIGIINNPSNHIFYSLVSLWEIEIKHLYKKNFTVTSGQFSFLCEQNYIDLLSINKEHINNLEKIETYNSNKSHKDPFDKMLLSQALTEKMYLITHDSKMLNYDIEYIISY